MRVRFWGTRGSLPAAANTLRLRRKVFEALKLSQGRTFDDDDGIDRFLEEDLPFSLSGYYGTNTSCVQMLDGPEVVICDAGSGIRDLSDRIMRKRHMGAMGPQAYHIFFSHIHWDHIQGLPLFIPCYMKGDTINIYGGHADMEEAFEYLFEHSGVPLPIRADMTFTRLEPGAIYEIGGFDVTCALQYHPGDSYGYRFEQGGRSVVYSTDCEHPREAHGSGYPFLDFFRGADLLIIDAQYPLSDAGMGKEFWGHTSNMVAVELGVDAGVRRLCLYHNEPTVDDDALDEFLELTRRYRVLYNDESTMQIDLAYDGLEINVG